MIVHFQKLSGAFPLRDKNCRYYYRLDKDYLFLDMAGGHLMEAFFEVTAVADEVYWDLYRNLLGDMFEKGDKLVCHGAVLAKDVRDWSMTDLILLPDYYVASFSLSGRRKLLMVIDTNMDIVGSKCDETVNSSPEFAQLIMVVSEIIWG